MTNFLNEVAYDANLSSFHGSELVLSELSLSSGHIAARDLPGSGEAQAFLETLQAARFLSGPQPVSNSKYASSIAHSRNRYMMDKPIIGAVDSARRGMRLRDEEKLLLLEFIDGIARSVATSPLAHAAFLTTLVPVSIQKIIEANKQDLTLPKGVTPVRVVDNLHNELPWLMRDLRGSSRWRADNAGVSMISYGLNGIGLAIINRYWPNACARTKVDRLQHMTALHRVVSLLTHIDQAHKNDNGAAAEGSINNLSNPMLVALARIAFDECRPQFAAAAKKAQITAANA